MVAAASGRLTLAAALISASWLSDALDGQLARRARSPTRLGRYDLLVDTAVGAALVAGLAAGGRLPGLPAAAMLLLLGGGYVLLRNPALSQALQALGYAALLWTLWSDGSQARWLPIATVALLLVVLHRRLLRVTIPAFLGGVAALPRLERRERFTLDAPDDDPR